MKAYAICGECGERIRLIKRKDFESFTKEEAYKHYEARHPEVLARYELGMPFTPIEFSNEVS